MYSLVVIAQIFDALSANKRNPCFYFCVSLSLGNLGYRAIFGELRWSLLTGRKAMFALNFTQAWRTFLNIHYVLLSVIIILKYVEKQLFGWITESSQKIKTRKMSHMEADQRSQ